MAGEQARIFEIASLVETPDHFLPYGSEALRITIELVTQQGTPDNEAKDILTLTVRARLQRVGREMKMLVENTDDQTGADPALLRIVARAHDIQERLMHKSGLTLHAIASQEHVTPGYVSRLLRLSSLAPDIITAIVNGKNRLHSPPRS